MRPAPVPLTAAALGILLGLAVWADPPVAAPTVPLPGSQGGLALGEAWSAAAALAHEVDPDARLDTLEGFENVRGLDLARPFDRMELSAADEALDGQILVGAWSFTYVGAQGPFLVVVEPGPTVYRLPWPGSSALGSSTVPAVLGIDSPQAALDCRRAGADDFLGEIVAPYLYYLGRPLRGSEDPWLLTVAVSSLSRAPGEHESAACRIGQPSGTLTYVNPEAGQPVS